MDRLRVLPRLPLDLERLFPETPFSEMRPTDEECEMSQTRGTNPDLYTGYKKPKGGKKGGGKKGC